MSMVVTLDIETFLLQSFMDIILQDSEIVYNITSRNNIWSKGYKNKNIDVLYYILYW